MKLYYDVIYSPDDSGYYAEVWDIHGKEVGFDAKIHTEGKAAANEAKRWISDRGDEAVGGSQHRYERGKKERV